MVIQLSKSLFSYYMAGKSDKEINEEYGVPAYIFESDLYKEIKLTLNMMELEPNVISKTIATIKHGKSRYGLDINRFKYVYWERDEDDYSLPCSQLTVYLGPVSILIKVQDDSFTISAHHDYDGIIMQEIGTCLEDFNKYLMNIMKIPSEDVQV